MKHIYTLLLLLSCMGIYAQGKNQDYDLIIKNDKTEVKAKVLAIEEYNVTYKKIENIEGPTYNMSKSDIFMILYANGTKETFDKPQQTQYTPAPVVQQAVRVTTETPREPVVIANTANEPVVDFSYNPIRLFYNFDGAYDYSLTFMIEESVGNPTNPNANAFSHFNLGVSLSGYGYSEDMFGASSELNVLDLGLYVAWYFPINKLMGSEKVNTGLFPYTYLGGVLRNTVSSVYYSGDTVKTDEYTGDITAGFGVDLKFTRGFGLAAFYDITYGPGAGITFSF